MKDRSTPSKPQRDGKRNPRNRRREAERKAARRAKYAIQGRTR